MKEKTQKQNIGNIGEELAARFLVKQGYDIVERNYRKPFGEIDIIGRKEGLLHFVEVKTVSRETGFTLADEYRPEDNVHQNKLKRIGRTIQAYLSELDQEYEWQFHVVTILLNSKDKTAKIVMMKDLIIDAE